MALCVGVRYLWLGYCVMHVRLNLSDLWLPGCSGRSAETKKASSKILQGKFQKRLYSNIQKRAGLLIFPWFKQCRTGQELAPNILGIRQNWLLRDRKSTRLNSSHVAIS